MLSKDHIEKLVNEKIKQEEHLDEQAGRSGHLSYIYYVINWIGEPEKIKEGIKVDYKYTLVVVTEFTIEPDNLPYTYPKTGSLIIKSVDPEYFS